MKYEAKQKKHRAPAPVLSCVLLLDVVPGEGWIDFSAQLGLGGGYYCRHPVDIWIIYGGRRHSQDMALCPLYMNHQGAFTHTAIVSLPADTVFREDFTFGTIGPNNIISGLAHLCPMVAHFSRPILRDSDDSEY